MAKKTILEAMAEPSEQVYNSFLDLVSPLAVGTKYKDWPRDGKYTPDMHAQACRLRAFGLDDTSIASALGIDSRTLREWMKSYPRLQEDMEMSLAISKSEIIRMLMQLMTAGNKVAFDAIKLFLTTRTSEYREKSEVGVVIASPTQMADAIRQMYGIQTDDDEMKEIENQIVDPLPPMQKLMEAPINNDYETEI